MKLTHLFDGPGWSVDRPDLGSGQISGAFKVLYRDENCAIVDNGETGNAHGRWFIGRPQDLERCAGATTRIPLDGRFGVFHSPGVRFAVGVSAVALRHLGFAVEDPDDHPLNLGPIAVLDPDDVRELRDALTEWLGS